MTRVGSQGGRARAKTTGFVLFCFLEIPREASSLKRRKELNCIKSRSGGFFSPQFHLTSPLILRLQDPFHSTTTSKGEGLLKLSVFAKKVEVSPGEDPYLEVYREGTEPDEAAGPRGPAPPGVPSTPRAGRTRRRGRGGGRGGATGGEKGVGFATGAVRCGSGSGGCAWRRRRELRSRESKQRAWGGGGKAAGPECERRWSRRLR